jgi:hypothetical protein
MSIPKERLDALTAAHGKLEIVTHGGRSYALACAPEAMVDRVFDLMFGGRLGAATTGLAEAYANLAVMSVVYPEEPEKSALFKRHRGLAIDLGLIVYQQAQAPREESEKKEPGSSEPPKTT